MIERIVRHRLFVALGVAGLSLLAALLVLVETRFHGLDISPDSTNYLAAARSIREGRGVRDITGGSMSIFPPVFPTVLALPAPVDPIDAGRWLNAALFALDVAAVGWWGARHLRPPVALCVCALVAVFTPLVRVHTWLWSEPLYITLSLIFLGALIEAVRSRRPPLWLCLLVGVAGAAAALTRYAGGILLPVAVVVILIARGSVRQRLRSAAIVGVAFVLPLAGWLIRDLILTGTAFGDREDSTTSLSANLHQEVSTMTAWFLDPAAPRLVQTAAAIAALALTVFVIQRVAREAGGERADARRTTFLVLAAYLVIDLGALVVSSSLTSIDRLDDRLLSPLAVPLLVAVAIAFDLAADGRSRAWTWGLGVLVLCLLGAHSAALGTARVIHPDITASSYSAPSAQPAPVRSLVDAIPSRATLLSDDPYALYFWASRAAREGPHGGDAASGRPTAAETEAIRAALRSGPVYLVWLAASRSGYVPPAILRKDLELQVVARSREGTVYRVRERSLPSAQAEP